MSLVKFCVSVAGGLLLTTFGAFAACQGSATLFEDGFDQLQPTWGEASSAMKVENSRLVVTPAPEAYFWVANTASLYDDVDFCVTVTTVAGVEPIDAKAGIVFWYVDLNNFYVFELAPNGKASVWRRQRGKWLAQVNWQDAEGAAEGDGAVNEMRVTTVGSQATFTINDKPFKQITGSPPDEGQQIGIFAVSPEKGSATYAFDNLVVMKP